MPISAALIDLARDLADVQQRLGGDAAPVQAHAADLVAVDADDVLSELAEPDRGVIAAGPAPMTIASTVCDAMTETDSP
jgi:hypothetical protein